MGWQNVLKVGLGMVPRGEVGMVVAQIGLGMSVISNEVYGVVVFMAVANYASHAPAAQIASGHRLLVPVEI